LNKMYLRHKSLKLVKVSVKTKLQNVQLLIVQNSSILNVLKILMVIQNSSISIKNNYILDVLFIIVVFVVTVEIQWQLLNVYVALEPSI
jgi:hypothetical protein